MLLHERWIWIGLLLVAMFGCERATAEKAVKPSSLGLISLELPEQLGSSRRPVVEFDHLGHVQALEKESCAVCHGEDGKSGAVPVRWRANDRSDLMDAFHDLCLACHHERQGPAACGECHVRRPLAQPANRARAPWDDELHEKHMEAEDGNCDGCHHVYDKRAGELKYAEGEEAACKECHKEKPEGNTPALAMASHGQCVWCHVDRASKKQKTGPFKCAECHGSKNRGAQ